MVENESHSPQVIRHLINNCASIDLTWDIKLNSSQNSFIPWLWCLETAYESFRYEQQNTTFHLSVGVKIYLFLKELIPQESKMHKNIYFLYFITYKKQNN